MVSSCVSVVLILSSGRWICSCSVWSVNTGVVPLVPTIMIIIGGTFHPLSKISKRRDWNLVVFC